MNRKTISATLLIVALLGAFALWWFSAPQVLKRRTRNLLQTLTIEAGSGQAGRQMGVYSLSAMLAPEVELESGSIQEANGRFEKAELESTFSWLCEQAKQTRFKIEKFNSVETAGDTGDVAFTLQALVELPAYRPADGRYDVKLHWNRGKDGWRLARAVCQESKN